MHWAKTYLKQAGLVEQPRRGMVQISAAGKKVLAAKPEKIAGQFLRQFPEFMSFLSRTKSPNGAADAAAPVPAAPSSTPEEQISAASLALDEALRDALLARVLEAPPAFFERLIVDLLLAMGYGGALIGKGAQKGVLITTSSFSRQAQAAASQSGTLRLVLIDGEELTRLMVRFNVGVRVARTVEIKRIDLDYFDETETE